MGESSLPSEPTTPAAGDQVRNFEPVPEETIVQEIELNSKDPSLRYAFKELAEVKYRKDIWEGNYKEFEQKLNRFSEALHHQFCNKIGPRQVPNLPYMWMESVKSRLKTIST
jgi:hypothetical protein